MVAAAWGSVGPFFPLFCPCPPCRDSEPEFLGAGAPTSSGALGGFSPSSCPPFPLCGGSVSLGVPLSPRERGMGPGLGGQRAGRERDPGMAEPEEGAGKSSYTPRDPPKLPPPRARQGKAN